MEARKRMVLFRKVTAVVFALGVGLVVALVVTLAQQPGITRTELQRHDLSMPGHEMVQMRVELDPGAGTPRHTHPGEEVVYILEGEFEAEIDGAISKVKAGDVSFIPAGKPHSVKNVGSTKGMVLATYIVEKDKPLVTPVK